MTVSIKHLFTSAKADSPDSTLVQPSNWNEEHVIKMGPNAVIGREAGAALEDATEIPMGAKGKEILGTSTDVEARTAIGSPAVAHTHSIANVTGLQAALDGKQPTIGFTPAPASRNVTAGDGLTGGGALTADRTIALGVPATLSGATTNNVTATSHTHAVNFGHGVASIGFGDVGSFVFAYSTAGATDPGVVRLGDTLRIAQNNDNAPGYDPGFGAGTSWRCLGRPTNGTPSAATLWLRIA